MNNDLLDAECVIQQLRTQNVILLKDRRLLSDSESVEVQFDVRNKTAVITVQFVKRTGQYFVPCTRIRILACKYGIKADIIYQMCRVEHNKDSDKILP